MASELSGLMIGGGLVLFASVASSFMNAQSRSSRAPNAAEAQKRFDAEYEEAKKKKTSIILTPRFSDAYLELRICLLRRGLILHMPSIDDNNSTAADVASKRSAILDLSPLLRDCPTFPAERQLHAALLSAGLLLSPGEAHGYKSPGLFRICCAHLTTAQIEEIGQRLTRVMQSFKPVDDSALSKRSSASANGISNGNADANSQADSAPKKKRRTTTD